MMGLEPTTFCMAKIGEHSRQFARVRSTGITTRLVTKRANARERERTRSAAIAATLRRRTLRRRAYRRPPDAVGAENSVLGFSSRCASRVRKLHQPRANRLVSAAVLDRSGS
jgi:hypothetical protein